MWNDSTIKGEEEEEVLDVSSAAVGAVEVVVADTMRQLLCS